MSLDREEMNRTGAELRRHLAASGLTAEGLGRWLGVSSAQISGVLAMDGTASPVDAWLVRDALDAVVRERTGEAAQWSILTDSARRKALTWFSLRDLPLRPGDLTA